jgi:hypothetical protein
MDGTVEASVKAAGRLPVPNTLYGIVNLMPKLIHLCRNKKNKAL